MRGKLGMVSRVQPFDPAGVDGMTAWLDASDSSTLFNATSGGSAVAADGAVARFEDRSGNGNHLTTFFFSDRPLRKTAIRNGLDVLRFDGANDYMSSTGTFSSYFSSLAGTCFVVAKVVSAPSDNTNPSQNASVFCDSYHGFFMVRSNNTAGSFGYDTAYRTASTSYTFGDWIVLSTWHDGSDLRVAINGGTASSQTLGERSNVFGSLVLGARADAASFLECDVGEIICYDEALPENDRENVESYLMTKWGI